MTLEEYELIALDTLRRTGRLTPGSEVWSEALPSLVIMAWQVTMTGLEGKGLVSSAPGPDGAVYTITSAGLSALSPPAMH